MEIRGITKTEVTDSSSQETPKITYAPSSDVSELMYSSSESKTPTLPYASYDALAISSYDQEILNAIEEEQIKSEESQIKGVPDLISAQAFYGFDNSEMNLDDIFTEHTNLKKESFVGEDGLKYLAVYPENLDPDKEYPMIVYLHGAGSRKISNPESLGRTMLNEIQNSDLDSFNGYILLPLNNSGWDKGDESEETLLNNAMDDFTSKHKVNNDQIALVAHSEGSGAALTFGTEENSRFRRTAIISGHKTGSASIEDIQDSDQVKGYAYHEGDGDASKIFGDELEILEGANHNTTPAKAFTLDEKGNNRSDMIEWLFGKKD